MAYNLYGSVPGTGDECILGDRIPVHSERLSLVLVKIHNREVIHTQIKQLERSISAGNDQLVLIDLRPSEIVKRIIRIEAVTTVSSSILQLLRKTTSNSIDVRFLNLDALRRQPQSKNTPIAHNAKVGRRRNGDARIVVRRVLDCIRIEALSTELKHGSHGVKEERLCQDAYV